MMQYVYGAVHWLFLSTDLYCDEALANSEHCAFACQDLIAHMYP